MTALHFNVTRLFFYQKNSILKLWPIGVEPIAESYLSDDIAPSAQPSHRAELLRKAWGRVAQAADPLLIFLNQKAPEGLFAYKL
jgi:hypothetical protein